MYGFKGGDKSQCVYPSVANVRNKFYEVYPGEPIETWDPTKGDVPLVGMSCFRFGKGKTVINF